jgi:hypothetical protein
MRKALFILLLIWCWVIPDHDLGAESVLRQKTPKQAATESFDVFCETEFYYLQDDLRNPDATTRESHIVLSKKKKLRLEKMNPEGDYLFLSLAANPLFIVKSYEIVNVSIKDKNHATAIVKYDRLARAKGTNKDWVREIIPERVKDEAVRYNLINTKEGWKVLDPPLPRISIEYVFMEYLRDKRNDEEWNKEDPDRIKKQSEVERHVRGERNRQFKIIEKLFHENTSKEDYQRVQARVEEWIDSNFHRTK